MSFQWTLIAGFLYFEIFLVTLLAFPFLSPRRWSKILNSQVFTVFQRRTAIYFYALLAILVLFLMDAIREVQKYSKLSTEGPKFINSEMKGNVKLFRAQRNMYITGFAIFLAFVLRRITTMILIQAELLDRTERIINEADHAKNLAKDAFNANEQDRAEMQNSLAGSSDLKKENEVLQTEIMEIKSQLILKKQNNEQLKKEIEAWKSKYEQLELLQCGNQAKEDH